MQCSDYPKETSAKPGEGHSLGRRGSEGFVIERPRLVSRLASALFPGDLPLVVCKIQKVFIPRNEKKKESFCEMTRRTQNLDVHPLGKTVRWRCWVGREASLPLFTAVLGHHRCTEGQDRKSSSEEENSFQLLRGVTQLSMGFCNRTTQTLVYSLYTSSVRTMGVSQSGGGFVEAGRPHPCGWRRSLVC